MAPAAVGSAEPHGQKRPAQDDLEGEQRLTKRLGRLHIGQNLSGKYNATSASNATPKTAQGARSHDGGDTMQVDDTETRVFVRDLDSELAELEAREQDEKNKIEFLPDIEKKLNGIPKGLLRDNDKSSTDEDQQLVLYRVPPSLSIPEDKDSVRRAMVEARRRAAEEETMNAPSDMASSINLPWDTSAANSQDDAPRDADPMDID